MDTKKSHREKKNPAGITALLTFLLGEDEGFCAN